MMTYKYTTIKPGGLIMVLLLLILVSLIAPKPADAG